MLDQYQKINNIRRKVFEEVARLAYEGGNYKRIVELPYKICEKSVGRSSIFLERAIVEERLRLAVGLPMRGESDPEPISKGIEEGKAQAKVPHVVRCPHCGADNEIIGKTGKCEYCQSKISYKE